MIKSPLCWTKLGNPDLGCGQIQQHDVEKNHVALAANVLYMSENDNFPNWRVRFLFLHWLLLNFNCSFTVFQEHWTSLWRSTSMWQGAIWYHPLRRILTQVPQIFCQGFRISRQENGLYKSMGCGWNSFGKSHLLWQKNQTCILWFHSATLLWYLVHGSEKLITGIAIGLSSTPSKFRTPCLGILSMSAVPLWCKLKMQSLYLWEFEESKWHINS